MDVAVSVVVTVDKGMVLVLVVVFNMAFKAVVNVVVDVVVEFVNVVRGLVSYRVSC